ncbi:MAG TPA: TonB-dependent receptor [Thermoanaerobaculia bacterium]|nr:TonB-dependent receptor [Thermoanaerobaculia bacterium]
MGSLRRCAALIFVLLSLGKSGFAQIPEDTPEDQSFSDEVTVTATRTEQRLGDTAASVVVLSSDELAASAAPTVDDALRQIPGFSLFRRAGSRFANPTAQGATLRGLGGSGTSRALVLADGVPLNDPFGGWIYWARVPRASLERVEVLRGAGSDLYGSGALAGVIQLLRRDAAAPALIAEAAAGELGTFDGSAFGAWTRNAWGVSLAAEGFETDGYVLVDPAERGPVDVPASSRHSSAEGTVERRLGAGGRLFARGSWFDEERGNGTPLQENDTEIRAWSAGGDWSVGAGALSLRLSGGDQEYRQTFTAVSAGRTSERLTRSQRVPSDFAGLSFQASRPLGDRHALVGGLEARQVRGTSDEVSPGGQPVSAGGRQRTSGLFLEDVVRATPRLSLTLGGRLDLWTNDENRGAERDESAFSPRASLLFQATERWAWTASAYRAFRAPTLNELYRAFRVGDVLTLANPELEAERLTGGETGALWTAPGGRITARTTAFWMEVEQTIANVTLFTQPGLITRQRRNLGRTRSRGLEAEATARSGRWTLSGGYLFTGARVESAPEEPGLEGLRLPQVPRHQVSFQMRFDDPRLASVGLQARWSGGQFDDDQNQFRLGSFTTVDALAERPLGRGLSLFAAAENLFDERFDIGRTPVRTVGPPRTVRVGVRVSGP